MTNGPAIVIKGTYEDWPDGPRKLTALEADRRRRDDADAPLRAGPRV